MSSALDKKIKTLREALPRLDDAEARRLLEKAGGSVNKASDMALEDGEWTSAAAKKKPAVKKDKPAAPERREDNKDRPRRDFADRKPRYEEPKATPKKPEVAATPSTILVGGSKTKVETGISFADMIKRQKQTEQPVEVAPEPEVAIKAPTEETAVAPEEPEVTATAPVAEVSKPKREKKEVKKKVAPLPQKYEAEIDRLSTVNFPSNILELASGAFTFTSEPGRAPTPPRQVQPIHQQPQQQLGQQNDWSHNAPRHPQQQPVQRTWNNQDGNNYNRNQHFANEWRQPQQRNYDNNMGYNNHRMNPQQQYRDYNSNNHVARPANQPAQTQSNNFW